MTDNFKHTTSMQFPPSFLDEIRTRLRTSEVVKRKVSLKQHGHEFQGCCPFHKEKTPSFTVSDEKGFYHCFGCNAHGDIVKFVMETENLPFPDAVKTLADMAGVPMPVVSPQMVQRQKTQQSLYEMMEMACKFFEDNLPNAKIAVDYINQRGLKPESIAKFRIGYAPDDRGALKRYLEGKDVTLKQMLDVGLLTKNDRGDIYDKFRGRVMFPILNIKNQVVAFGGRILGDGKPKYLNSPETVLFKKGEMLYNENNARKLAFKTGKVVVAEGYMDVIALDAAGIKTAMAPLGTAITNMQIRRLWNMASEPVICLDGDAAGRRAMDRAANLCLPMLEPGYTLKFAVLSGGLDPDDYIKKYGVANMRKVLQNAKALSEVIWEDESEKKDISTPEQKAELEKRLNDISEKIENETVAKYYKDFFRNKLWQFYKGKYSKNQPAQKKTDFENLPDFNDNTINGCQAVFVLLLWMHPELLKDDDIHEEYINIEFLSDKLDKIGQAIIEVSSLHEDITNKDLQASLESQGMSDYIGYLEDLKQVLFLGENIEYEKAESAWKYYLCVLQLLYLKSECEEKQMLMTPESEEEVAIRRREISNMEKRKLAMEAAFEQQ